MPDLVVPTSGQLGILLGNGDGTFQPALLYGTGGGITAVADLNNDGKPDVVAAGGRINVLLTKTGVSTKTVVATSGSPTDVGQQVTFTARVTSSAGIIPEGELMAFYDGINALGQVKLAGGTAVLTTSGLSPKTHNIGATYVGDEAFRLGSGHVQQKVLKYQTTTSLASSVNPSTYGRSVTLTARVMPSGPFPPAGTVTFKNVSTGLGIVSVNASGAATLTKTTLPVGSDAVTATYNGDALNGRSTSSAIIQTVNQAQITMTLSSSLNPCEHGQSVKFTATLTSNGGLPSGQTVTFSYNGNPLGTARIAGDKATLLTTTLPFGSDVVTATYAGDTNHSSATASVMQAVN